MAIRDDLTTWVALKSVEGVGSVAFRNLLAAHGTPRRVFEASLPELEQTAGLNHRTARNIKDFRGLEQARAEVARADREGVSIVTSGDPAYPERLRRIYDYPPLLYIKGTLTTEDIPVAVVGSRNASLYGRYVTERLCRELAYRGVNVVSGLARGIDTCAHRGAFSGRGRTIAVMGCGIDVIYQEVDSTPCWRSGCGLNCGNYKESCQSARRGRNSWWDLRIVQESGQSTLGRCNRRGNLSTVLVVSLRFLAVLLLAERPLALPGRTKSLLVAR